MPAKKQSRASNSHFDNSPSSSKKPRLDLPSDDLWSKIQTLPPSTRDLILYDACKQNNSISKAVDHATKEISQKEELHQRTQSVVDFDNYSREAWYILTHKHPKKSASKIILDVEKICDELLKQREEIVGKAGKLTKYETRRNALEVLRKICKSIMLCEDEMIRSYEDDGQTLLDAFGASMLELSSGMTVMERERYRDEGFYEKLVELKEHREEGEMWILESIHAVFELVEGGVEAQGKQKEVTRQDVNSGGSGRQQKKPMVINLDSEDDDDDVKVVGDW